MRNQGDVSWCYAHAAADYLQFVQKIPEQISAADIAVNFNLRRWPRFLQWLQGGVVPESGFIRGAIFDILPQGYCPEEYFPSEKWKKRVLNGKNQLESIEVPLKLAMDEVFSLVKNVELGIYQSPADLPYVYEFKGMSSEQFMEVIFSSSEGQLMNQLRTAACENHRKPFPGAISNILMSIRGKKTFYQINDLLNKNMPVSVDYFYGFLNDRDSYRRTFSDLHTTLLMGRRFSSEEQECQYLIKNSYGEDCSEYDQRHQCERGYVWVTESSLYRAMTSYVQIMGNASIAQGD
jgi:hypothetical protein